MSPLFRANFGNFETLEFLFNTFVDNFLGIFRFSAPKWIYFCEKNIRFIGTLNKNYKQVLIGRQVPKSPNLRFSLRSRLLIHSSRTLK